ncbi:MAG: PDZ domain-containing protein [Geminicoccaceae bacterium]
MRPASTSAWRWSRWARPCRSPCCAGASLTLDLAQPAGQARHADRRTLDGNQPLSGITVANLSPATGQSLGLDPFESGVTVLGIERGSFATRLGLRPGDTIHAINGEVVASTAELERMLHENAGRWVVTIGRGGQLFDLTIS